MNNSDMPAMPICNSEGFPTLEGYLGGKGEHEASGLTKREYFAGLAMQGLISRTHCVEGLAIYAVEMADALLKELDK